MMWTDTPFTRAFGLRYPIVQAPMAGTTTPEMAAAVSRAGALGSHGCAMLPPAALAEVLEALPRLTNAPVNLNFMCHTPGVVSPARARKLLDRLAPHYAEAGVAPPDDVPGKMPPPFGGATLELLLAHPPAVASFQFGMPEPVAVERLKAAGTRIIATATCVAEAKVLEAAGCDAVVAQGWEAGGHRGWFLPEHRESNIGLMALVPQVVDAVSVPVIAAGGIADGRGIAAALALGASGVQIGTAFVPTAESAAPPLHSEAIAGATDHSTRVTRAFTGREARAQRTAFIDEMAHEETLPFPLQHALAGPLAEGTRPDEPAAYQFLLYGQSAALARPMPAADLVARLVQETGAVLSGTMSRA